MRRMLRWWMNSVESPSSGRGPRVLEPELKMHVVMHVLPLGMIGSEWLKEKHIQWSCNLQRVILREAADPLAYFLGVRWCFGDLGPTGRVLQKKKIATYKLTLEATRYSTRLQMARLWGIAWQGVDDDSMNGLSNSWCFINSWKCNKVHNVSLSSDLATPRRPHHGEKTYGLGMSGESFPQPWWQVSYVES